MLKENIQLFQSMLRFLEHKGHGISDYKRMLIGQKYTVRDAMGQLR